MIIKLFVEWKADERPLSICTIRNIKQVVGLEVSSHGPVLSVTWSLAITRPLIRRDIPISGMLNVKRYVSKNQSNSVIMLYLQTEPNPNWIFAVAWQGGSRGSWTLKDFIVTVLFYSGCNVIKSSIIFLREVFEFSAFRLMHEWVAQLKSDFG